MNIRLRCCHAWPCFLACLLVGCGGMDQDDMLKYARKGRPDSDNAVAPRDAAPTATSAQPVTNGNAVTSQAKQPVATDVPAPMADATAADATPVKTMGTASAAAE